MSTDNRLIALWGVVLFGLSGLAAAATAPGTSISGAATLDYQVGGIAQTTVTSNTVTLTVDELLEVDVTRQSSASLNVASPSTGRSAQFRVANTGNGSESFNLVASNGSGVDEYDVTFPGTHLYLDDGDDVFEPGTGDTAITNPVVLAAGAFIDVWVAVDIPTGRADGDDANVSLTATSTNGTGTVGSRTAGAGDGGVGLVYGLSAGDDVDQVEFNVLSLSLSLVKSQAVIDTIDGGNDVVPGSTITYTIVASATGTGTATSVTVSDLIPTNTTFVAGSLRLNTVAKTDAADADECVKLTGPHRISCTLPDLTNGSSHTVSFQVTID